MSLSRKTSALANSSDGRGRLVTLTSILVLASLIVLLLAVLPAGAGPGPASTIHNITPQEVDLGGQKNDCAAVGSTAAYELRIENPQDGTTYDGVGGAQFRLDVYESDKKLAFELVGGTAAVFDAVVKGGQNSAWFAYLADGGPGGVTEDDGLHAPTKGGGSNLFNVSHVSLCYSNPIAEISGTVFLDENLDGEYQSGSESPDVGVAVTVYQGNAPVATQLSAGNGGYSFLLPVGSNYTVCEAARDDYGQTTPTGNTACQSLGDSEAAGHVTPAGDGLDFGNWEVACGGTFPASGGVFDSLFTVFDSGDDVFECDNKLAFAEVNGTGVLFALSGGGTFAAIGEIEKSFTSPDNFVPLEYSQNVETPSFEVVPWCEIRNKVGGDPGDFIEYLGTGSYPELPSGETACKVYEGEDATGLQINVLYIAGDPYFR